MLSFAKGHGTRNDFVVMADPDGRHDLSDADVRLLCDRRAGIGGDGVLRAVRARHVAGWGGDPGLWFMDYRNADGSVAEMCGNGARVFARFLREEGLIAPDAREVSFGTRAGVREASFLPDGRVRVWMGRPRVDADACDVRVGTSQWRATAVDVGNPHAVSLVDADALPALELIRQPIWSPADRFPDGVNLEFVTVTGPRRARMRVHERGVGETQSCGTGTVAVAAALAAREGATEASWTIHVPGGTVTVDLADGQAWLSGPAEIVAWGKTSLV